MIRVARHKVVIADLNKKGELILKKVHAQEGRTHERLKISFSDIKKIFEKAKMTVKTYRSQCQTVVVAEKG
ncbi:MAG: hypothetical protein KKH11_02145 [Candidatus Omnitrophica bacterium]|nr:hypothetical protein [Candidatus Omnitrophota bacterium]